MKTQPRVRRFAAEERRRVRSTVALVKVEQIQGQIRKGHRWLVAGGSRGLPPCCGPFQHVPPSRQRWAFFMTHNRFLRSKAKRAALWLAAEGRCQMCGCPLPDDWHADHVVPWVESGRTNVHEMQALCPACNLKKGARMSLDLSKARPGQEGAYTVILERLAAGESSTAIVLPTGYGKSDLIRMVAFSAWDANLACCTLALSPNDYLRGQLVSDRKFAEFASRFCPRPQQRNRRLKYGAIASVGTDYAANGEFLLSTTIQLVDRNASLLVEWVKSMQHRTGLPVMIVVDETHTNSIDNEWGNTLLLLKQAGAHLVVMTATAFREDKLSLVGFEDCLVEISSKPIEIKKVKPGKDPEHVWVELWRGCETHYEIRPHFQVKFKEAWNEGVLCHVNHHRFDVALSVVTANASDDRMLSDLNETDTRKALGKFVRHPEVIRAGCQMFSTWLSYMRTAAGICGRDIAGIVFCANDGPNDETVNRHAEQIRTVLRGLDSSLDVKIATSATDSQHQTKSGVHVLEQFVENGRGDALVVKQMAGLGLDSPRTKVILDLSPVRTPTAFIQRINRATRPYNGIMVSHLITLADILSTACFEALVESEGGATVEDIAFASKVERPRQEAPEPTKHFVFQNVVDGDLRDTKQKTASRDQVRAVVVAIEAFPILLSSYTIPEIAERLGQLGIVAPPMEDEEPAIENTTPRVRDLRNKIAEAAKAITKIRLARMGRKYTKAPEDQELYGETISAVWVDAKQASKFPEDIEYKKTTDIALLERFDAAMEALLQQEFGS